MNIMKQGILVILGATMLILGCTNQAETDKGPAQGDQTTVLKTQIEEIKDNYENLQVQHGKLQEENRELQNRLAIIEEKSKHDKGQEMEEILSEPIEEYPTSMLHQRTFDLKNSGTEQTIELYAHVEKIDGEEGEYAWDDGQRWLLVVKDGEKTYPLFDDRIQLGSLTYWLFTTGETPTLVLLHTATASFHVQTFTYDAEEDSFVRNTIYNPTMVNFWGSSNY
jgi:regulator of replication initiation timing